MENKYKDLSSLGEQWMNGILDMQYAVSSLPSSMSHGLFYVWGARPDDDTYTFGADLVGEDVDALMVALEQAFEEDPSLATIFTTVIGNFIKNQSNYEELKQATLTLLNID